jgi:hypothetical protein
MQDTGYRMIYVPVSFPGCQNLGLGNLEFSIGEGAFGAESNTDIICLQAE